VTSDKSQPPAGGLSPVEARERYCDPKIRERYHSLGDEIGWSEGIIFGRPEEPTADEIERAHKINEFKEARADVIEDFRSKLKSGELLAWAREGSPLGPWREIPTDSWNVFWSFSWKDSTIKGPDDLKLYSVNIYKAELIGVAEGASKGERLPSQESDQALAPRKGDRGRKPKWNWEAAARELVRLANSLDGLPQPQARIEKHIAHWFLDNFDDQPSESMIRKFVAKYLPPDYRD